MFQNKKVIIFDMDGTLIDSVGIWNQVDCELIQQLGNVILSQEEIQVQRVPDHATGSSGLEKERKVIQANEGAAPYAKLVVEALESNDDVRISHITEDKHIQHRRQEQKVREGISLDIRYKRVLLDQASASCRCSQIVHFRSSLDLIQRIYHTAQEKFSSIQNADHFFQKVVFTPKNNIIKWRYCFQNRAVYF